MVKVYNDIFNYNVKSYNQYKLRRQNSNQMYFMTF